jgi:hypothetical protein
MTYISPNTSSPGRLANHSRVSSQTLGSEALPDLAAILATRKVIISLNDRIARIHKVRPALLEFHSVDHESDNTSKSGE